MSLEENRFQRIVADSGMEFAIQWEREAADRYRIAMVQAIHPEWKGGAKGLEWAQKYCDAARGCDQVANKYSGSWK